MEGAGRREDEADAPRDACVSATDVLRSVSLTVDGAEDAEHEGDSRQMTRPTGHGAPEWAHEEFDTLFDAFPPHGARPRPEQLEALGIPRATGAVLSLWDDAYHWLQGKEGTSSQRLRDYLEERGYSAERVGD